MRRKLIVLLILITIGLSSALALTAVANRHQAPTEFDNANLPPNIIVIQELSLMAYTREELIDGSAVIFEGKILSISPTFYNQDSGEYWGEDEDGTLLQLHSIQLEVLRPIVDTLGMEKQVTIYVLGASPLDGGTMNGDGYTIVQAGGNHEMKVGDQVIFFVSQIGLAWREGGIRTLMMIYPPLDNFVQMPDGTYYDPWDNGSISLDVLIGEIAGRRTTFVQP